MNEEGCHFLGFRQLLYPKTIVHPYEQEGNLIQGKNMRSPGDFYRNNLIGPKSNFMTLLVIQIGLLFSQAHAQQDREAEKLSVQAINQIRQHAGAKPLRRVSKLDSAAAIQARWCAENDKLTHIRTGGRLRTPDDRIESLKYYTMTSGENILCFTTDQQESPENLSKRMVQIWKNSPGHYANMRDKSFQDTGFAVAWNPDRTMIYACQVFASPDTRRKWSNFLSFLKD